MLALGANWTGLAFGQLPQILKAESSAKVLLVGEGPLNKFETGAWLKAGEVLDYQFTVEPKEARVRFDVHSHDLLMKTVVYTTQIVTGSHEGQFRAPSDGSFYPYWENLSKSEVSITYRVTPPSRTFPVSLDGRRMDVTIVSNSQVMDVGADVRGILVRAQTPLFMGGYVNVTFPAAFETINILVDREPSKFQSVRRGNEVTYSVGLSEGTHEVVFGAPAPPAPKPAGSGLDLPFASLIALISVLVAGYAVLRTKRRGGKRRRA